MTAQLEMPAPTPDSGQSPPPSPAAESPLALKLEKQFQEGVARILEAFEFKLAYDASKQQQIDLLHAELQQHRSDLFSRAARPLIHGVIRLHDDIGKLVAELRGKPEADLSPKKVFTLLEDLQEDIELVLSQNGVTSYREAGSTLDLRRQRVLRKVPTPDPALANKVAERIRPGFEQGGDILEKERVAAYSLEQASTPSQDQES